MKKNDHNDPHSAMRDLQFDNYYDSSTRILHANWDEGFFSNTTTALWALTDLANEGISPKQIQCTRGWDKYCDRSVHGNLDLYPMFFCSSSAISTPPAKSISGRVWPSYNHRRYALTNLNAWIPFVERWFQPSSMVLDLERDISRRYEFDPSNTIGFYYRGTDKNSELSIASVNNYLKYAIIIAQEKPKHKIYIQTDQCQVREAFKDTFGDRFFAVKEMPVTSGNIGFHFLSNDELNMTRLDFGALGLVVTRMLAKCDTLINCTGNMAWWVALYRGNTEKMYQFDENGRIADPKGRDFTRNPLKQVVRATKDFFRF